MTLSLGLLRAPGLAHPRPLLPSPLTSSPLRCSHVGPDSIPSLLLLAVPGSAGGESAQTAAHHPPQPSHQPHSPTRDLPLPTPHLTPPLTLSSCTTSAVLAERG